MPKTYLHEKLNMNNDEMRSGEICMVRMNGLKVGIQVLEVQSFQNQLWRSEIDPKFLK
jgi:hypothetical protein